MGCFTLCIMALITIYPFVLDSGHISSLVGMCPHYQGTVQVIIVQICGVPSAAVQAQSLCHQVEKDHDTGMWERRHLMSAFFLGFLDEVGETYNLP